MTTLSAGLGFSSLGALSASEGAFLSSGISVTSYLTIMGVQLKKNSRVWLLSELSSQHAARGYLNLRYFELIASFAILGRTNFGDILHQGLVLVILHTRQENEYNCWTLEFPDLNSLEKESSSKSRSRVTPAESIRSPMELPPILNWLNRDAKLIILLLFQLQIKHTLPGYTVKFTTFLQCLLVVLNFHHNFFPFLPGLNNPGTNWHLNYTNQKMANFGDMEHAMLQYIQTIQEYKKRKLNLVHFADGWIFATLLQSASNFKIKYAQLIQNCTKWTHRLTNLKKIVALIEEYFEEQVKKGIKTKDVDLIEIAKNYNVEQTLKMFELIIAVLTEAPNKEDHINTIMSLDQKSQGTFVFIIQNLLENRILDKNETKEDKIFETINHLQMENSLLRSEVESLLNQNYQLDKEIQDLKHKQADYEEELRRARDQEIDKTHVLHQEPKEKQHLRNMIENLKEKLISTVRESEIKISGLREEIHMLESKCAKLEEIQQQLEDYKRKYFETTQSHGKAKLWERQKNKLLRAVEEKEEVIKKLNAKLDQANELNFAMQEKQVYTKMQLEKRDVRFKELQKEVKKKYGTNSSISLIQNPGSAKSLQLTNTNVAVLSQEINQIDRLEIQELKNEIQQLKKKNRDSERQSNKLKRSLEKASGLESEKKKLQRLILELNNQKREQVEVLLSTTYQFYSENQRLRQLLQTRSKVA